MPSLRQICFSRPTRAQFALSLLFFLILGSLFLRKNGDFDVFYAGGVRFLMGARVHITEPSAFTYPTFLAMVSAPITLLGHFVSMIAFFIVSCLSMVVGIRVVNHHLLSSSSHNNLVFWISSILCLRYFIGVFQNQQSDLIIFALIILGIHYYCCQKTRGVMLWSFAALVKSNPLFMILLPFYQRKVHSVVIILLLCSVGMVLPDAVRSVILKFDQAVTEQGYLDVPASLIGKQDDHETNQFVVLPSDTGLFAHAKDYIKLTLAFGQKKWWQNSSNKLNQSLTISTLRYFPDSMITPAIAFIFWCCVFSFLLFLLVVRGKADLFVVGLLFYTAFVLIGPMASKPHFVAFYGLIVYAWKDLLDSPGWLRLILVTTVSILFGLTSKGVLGNYAEIFSDHGYIGLSGFFLWIYVYISEHIKTGA